MKLIEALKEKKLNKKKVAGTTVEIQKYASITSVEKPAFESEESQKREIIKRLQSAMDLLKRRAELKEIIDKTNLETKMRIPKGVIIPEHEISLAEALVFKNSYDEYIKIFNSLNTLSAESKLKNVLGGLGNDGTRPHAIQLYDEEYKNNCLKDLAMKFDYIDAHMEMINATTDVIYRQL